MKVVILQSNYIPWKGYFDLIHDADVFVYYDEVKYTKNDWRNRNRIYTRNGLQWLSIPISKDAVKQKISEVEITDERWQDLHFKTLSMGYKSAPFYSQLEPLLRDVYLDHRWKKLVDVDRYLIEKISRMLGIETMFVDSLTLDARGDRIERLVSILKKLEATEYISGPSAKNYLDGSEHLFQENNIALTYKSYSYPPYKQLSLPFEHGVSVVDILANIELSKVKEYIWKNESGIESA